MRTAFAGWGWRLTPLGASIGLRSELLFVSTADPHFLSLFTRSEHEVCAIKQSIHDVGLIFHPVVRHLAFAVLSEDKQHGRFTVLQLGRHLDVGLCAVVKDAHGPEVFIAAADRVIEVDFFYGDHRWRYVRRMFLLFRQSLL